MYIYIYIFKNYFFLKGIFKNYFFFRLDGGGNSEIDSCDYYGQKLTFPEVVVASCNSDAYALIP